MATRMLRCAAVAIASTAVASAANIECDLAIVGAGAGGAYAAWRAAEGGEKVCVFERSDRPGGRIHSIRNLGPKQDLVVEAGGYRFAIKTINFGADMVIKTPLTKAIVQELKLKNGIYNPIPTQWDHWMHKLVDEDNQDVGFLTLVETMLHKAEEYGAKVRFESEVVAINLLEETPDQGLTVRLKSGDEVTAAKVLFNIPQRPLIQLLRNSDGPLRHVYPEPLYNPISYGLLKLYVHYEDAWWQNYLGYSAGPFFNKDAGAPDPSLPAVGPAPLKGAYHDGDVRCDGPDGKCRGFLQAYYGSDGIEVAGGSIGGAMRYYAPFIDAVRGDSATHIKPEYAAHHRVLLEEVHKSLVELHRAELDAKNLTAKISAMRPTEAVMSFWSEGVEGMFAGCHMPKRLVNGSFPPLDKLAEDSLEPIKGWPLYVANEAFGHMRCFAEGSLAMANEAVKRMGIPDPLSGWLNDVELEHGEVKMPMTDPFFLEDTILRADEELVV